MSELEKNIIQRSLSSTQASSVLCLFMLYSLPSNFRKQTIEGHHHHWTFYAFASSEPGAGAAAGAGPPVVGLEGGEIFISISCK